MPLRRAIIKKKGCHVLFHKRVWNKNMACKQVRVRASWTLLEVLWRFFTLTKKCSKPCFWLWSIRARLQSVICFFVFFLFFFKLISLVPLQDWVSKTCCGQLPWFSAAWMMTARERARRPVASKLRPSRQVSWQELQDDHTVKWQSPWRQTKPNNNNNAELKVGKNKKNRKRSNAD